MTTTLKISFFLTIIFITITGCNPNQDVVAPESGSSAVSDKARLAATGPTDQQIITLLNVQRRKFRLDTLKTDVKLTKAALDHAKDMAARKTVSHKGSNGYYYDTRVLFKGYNFAVVNELLGRYPTPQLQTSMWMNGEYEKNVILQRNFQHAGVGSAVDNTGQKYWVLVLASPKK
jgi:uncharacterized protein YkwD